VRPDAAEVSGDRLGSGHRGRNHGRWRSNTAPVRGGYSSCVPTPKAVSRMTDRDWSIAFGVPRAGRADEHVRCDERPAWARVAYDGRYGRDCGRDVLTRVTQVARRAVRGQTGALGCTVRDMTRWTQPRLNQWGKSGGARVAEATLCSAADQPTSTHGTGLGDYCSTWNTLVFESRLFRVSR
jgi:hypothetical protein